MATKTTIVNKAPWRLLRLKSPPVKPGDIVMYDSRLCVFIGTRNEGKDNVNYILSASDGIYNLGKYQRDCIKSIEDDSLVLSCK